MDCMERKALVKYISSLVLFGFNGILASLIAMDSYEIVFLRTLLGSALLIAIFLIKREKSNIKGNGKDLAFVSLSGVAMGIGWMFMYEGYQQVGVVLTTVLCYCGPVIVMALSPVIFKEKITWHVIAAFAVVMTGMILVSGPTIAGGGSSFGIFCGIMTAVMYFFMIVLNKRSEKITGFENAVIQLTSAFIAVAVFLIARQGFSLEVPSDAWPWILLLGLVNTGIGCYLYFSPLSRLRVQTFAVCVYIEPLSALVFSSLFLGETMTGPQTAGAALILGGALFGELMRFRAAARHA